MQKGSAIIIVCLMLVLIGSLHAIICNKFEEITDKVIRKLNGTCYYGIKENVTWWEAERKCRNEGTHLAHLETKEEENKICRKFYRNNKKSAFVWTGLLKVGGKEPEWIWYFNETTWKPAGDDFNETQGRNASYRLDQSTVGTCAGLAMCHSKQNFAIMPLDMADPNAYLCEDREPESGDYHTDEMVEPPSKNDEKYTETCARKKKNKA